MNIGVVFPQVEIGNDPAAIRAYAQAVEAMGYTHILAFDHVLGANPPSHPGLKGPYSYKHPFHEPFVLFGFLAAVTRRVELVTGIIILPQRQTALVAKQTASVDVLSGGRLRLGVAVGWNFVEYEALGENFTNRGRRLGEQVELMRRLWTEQTVTFDGKHHRVTGAGLAPLPVTRPIPVWIGAASRPALERAGRLADGWFPMMSPGPQLDEARDIVARSAIAAGKDPSAIGMEGRVTWRGDVRQAADELAQWTTAGATHVSVNTMGAGLRTVDEHLAALAAVAGNIRV